MIGSWQGITGVTNFSFKRVMSTESELLLWKSMGLPSDDLSQENSLVIAGATSDRVPFVIDPASACTDWLRRLLSNDKNRPLEVVTHHDPRFSNQVELAVRFGKTLLILEVRYVTCYLLVFLWVICMMIILCRIYCDIFVVIMFLVDRVPQSCSCHYFSHLSILHVSGRRC